MERLGNLRAVIGWLAWSALVIMIALVVVGLLTAGRPPADLLMLSFSLQLSYPVPYVVLALAVLAARWPPEVGRARLLAILSAVVAAIGLLLAVVLAAFALFASVRISTASSGLPSLLICVVSCAVLIGLSRQAGPPPAEIMIESAEDHSPALPEPEAEAPTPAKELEPIWLPEEAAGAVWMTAGDAASGASASGWGSSTADSGWQPSSDQTDTDQTVAEDSGNAAAESGSHPEPAERPDPSW